MTDSSTAPDQSQGERYGADIAAALGANRLDEAVELAVRALADGWRSPLMFSLASFRFEREGRYVEAANLLQQGLEVYPNDLELLTALGLCLDKSGQARRAVAAFDTVLQAVPDSAPAHHGKGSALERLNDPEAAERHYRAAIELMPDFADALGALSALLARRGRHEEAMTFAERALIIDAGRADARYALAVAQVASGEAGRAEPVLRAVIDDEKADPETRASALTALGHALDAQGRRPEAFDAYAEANRRLRAVRESQSQADAETYMELARRLTAWFANAKDGDWRPDPGVLENGAAGHVFIVGVSARSGSDRLRRMLETNPSVALVEGGDALVAPEREFLMTPGGLERLATLDPNEARAQREAYWRRTTALVGDPKGKIVVDRAPVGAATLCLIAALFPQAKIILALRDPRDIVLASFRRPGLVNPDLYPYLSLEGAAEVYDATMRLLEASWERLPIEIAEMRLEDIVADPDSEARSLAAFLGVEWTPAMGQAAAATDPARMSRGDTSRWRDYADQLAPVLPGLASWVQRLGYPEA